MSHSMECNNSNTVLPNHIYIYYDTE